jgi:hypothetical protein
MSKILGCGAVDGNPVVGSGSLEVGGSPPVPGSAGLVGSSGSAAATPIPKPLISNAAMSAALASNTRITTFGTTLSFQLHPSSELAKYSPLIVSQHRAVTWTFRWPTGPSEPAPEPRRQTLGRAAVGCGRGIR